MFSFTNARRSRGFTVCEILIVAGIVTVVAGLLFQGGSFLRGHAEAATLLARAGHLGSALQMHYAKHRAYPDAFPARLEEDLAPYVGDQAAFNVPGREDEGAAPINASYVTPVQGDCNSYVLSLDSKRYESRSAVLFSDLSAQIVEKLPILHNEAEVACGSLVNGGTIEFGTGSTVQLSNSTAARLVQSFTATDGTSFNIIRLEEKAVSASVTAIAIDTDIIEIASYPGIVFMRGGVTDTEVSANGASDELKVTARSGEVRVIGRMQASGQSVADAIENDPGFEIDEDQNVIPDQDCVASITVLGTDMRYGSSGQYHWVVKAGAKIGDNDWQWLFGNAEVHGGEVFTTEVAAGTPIAVKGRAVGRCLADGFKSDVHFDQVIVLVDGDTPPEFVPYGIQDEIVDFLRPILDPDTGKVVLESHQAIYLFELYTTDQNSNTFDMQDLVLLVDLGAGTDSQGGNGGPLPDPPPPTDEVTIAEDGTITVNEDCSLAVRVLGKSLKNGSGSNVPITMKIQVDGTWSNLRHGNKMYTHYRYKREVDAGSTIILQATSCDGSDSASYHSADGTGHVLTTISDEVPEPFGRDEPVPIKSMMSRAVDIVTGQVTLAPNQVLMMYELACEDTSDPDTTFQSIAVVLTFIPQSLHSQNKNSTNFDGYQGDVMGEGAQEFADEKEFAWSVGRAATENDDVVDDGGNNVDNEAENTDTGGNSAEPVEMRGQTVRTFSRGISVHKGRWVRVIKRR